MICGETLEVHANILLLINISSWTQRPVVISAELIFTMTVAHGYFPTLGLPPIYHLALSILF